MTVPLVKDVKSGSASATYIPGTATVVYGDWGPWFSQLFETESWTPGHFGGGPNDNYEYDISGFLVSSGSLNYWQGQARSRTATVVYSGGGVIPLAGIAVPVSSVAAVADIEVAVISHDSGAVTGGGWTPVAVGADVVTGKALSVLAREISVLPAAAPTFSFSVGQNGAEITVITVSGASMPDSSGIATHASAAGAWVSPAVSPASDDSLIITAWASPGNFIPEPTYGGVQTRRSYSASTVVTSSDQLTAGSTTRSITPAGTAGGIAAIVSVPPDESAPYAPIWVRPNPAVADFTVDNVIEWHYGDPQGAAADPQSAVELKATIAGVTHWYNGTNWSSTTLVTWATAASQLLIPANTFTNDDDVTFSIKTRDTLGLLWSPASPPLLVLARLTPTVSLSGPADVVIDTTSPLFAWDATNADIFRLALYPPNAFDLGQITAPPLWVSGDRPATVSSYRYDGTPLHNGAIYLGAIQVERSEGLKSAWAFKQFVISVPPAAPPIVTWVDVPSAGRIALQVLGQDNRATAAQAQAEGAVLGWEPRINVSSIDFDNADAPPGISRAYDVTITDVGDATIGVADRIVVGDESEVHVMLSVKRTGAPLSFVIETTEYAADGVTVLGTTTSDPFTTT